MVQILGEYFQINLFGTLKASQQNVCGVWGLLGDLERKKMLHI